GNGFGTRRLRILPRSGRPMDARSAGQRNRAQPVRRKKLGSEGGEFAGSSPSGRRGKFTVEKCKQTKNKKNMNKHTQAPSNDMGTLAEDARALMAATADVAGEKVGEARKRLAAALDSAREIAGNVRDRAIAGAKATDEAVREHPYQAIGIALGVGVLIGYLVSRPG